MNWSPVNSKTTFLHILDMSHNQCPQAMGACLLKCQTEIVTDSQWVVDKFTHVHIVMVAI